MRFCIYLGINCRLVGGVIIISCIRIKLDFLIWGEMIDREVR